MKKLIYCAAAMTALVFTACQQEVLEPVSENASVTFTVDVPVAAATKALGDNVTNINDLVYAVYRTEATTLEAAVADMDANMLVYQKNPASTAFANGRTNVTIELLNDQNYVILFWAQVNDAWVAGDDFDLTNITYPANMSANNADLAAFSGVSFIEKASGAITKDVTLTRPFAQINLGTTLPVNFTVELTTSDVTVTNAGKSFSVATQAASDNTEVTFTADVVPAKFTPAEVLAANGAEYTYLAMNYVFANGNVEVEYNINTAAHGTVNNSVPNVPVQKNYRTNIVGNLLTTTAEYEVILDAEWGTPANEYVVWDGESFTEPATAEVNGETVYLVENASDLAWLAAAVNGTLPATRSAAPDTFEGKTFVLTSDIDLNNQHWTPIGYWETFNGTFDGQGYTIKNLRHHGTEEDCYVGLFGYAENATIKNVTIENVDMKLVGNASWAGGHMGALVGALEGTSVIENITVKGDVKIEGDLTMAGAGRIGAVVGGNATSVALKNVVVDANEGSYVKGNNAIGGIAGQLQGVISFEDCSSNIDVTAQQFYAGGIIGLAPAKTSFTNCSTSGDISVLAGRKGNANDLYRVGGIAGGWGDNTTYALVLDNCSYTGKLAGQSADGTVATSFDCAGFVGRGYVTEVGAKVVVNGAEYVYQGNGVYALGDALLVANAAGLQAALDAKASKIVLLAGTYDGTFAIKANNTTIEGQEGAVVACINLNGAKNTTIKNVEFDAAKAVRGYDYKKSAKQFANIITGDLTNNPIIGAHGVVIDGCKFTGKFANGGASIAFTDYNRTSGFSGNITIKNCTFDTENAYYNIYGHYCGNGTNGFGDFVIENNTFNTTFTAGGAIYLGRYASSTPVVVKGNTFNVAKSLDEAMYVQDHSNYGVSINASNNTFAN